MADFFAFGVTFFQGGDVGISYAAVVVKRKDERNIDVDTIGQRLLNGRNSFWCRWNLDQQIRAINRLPEAADFGERALCIVCQFWRDFEADEAILPVGPIIDRAQDVSYSTNVAYDESFVDLVRALPFLDKLCYLLVIGIAATDRLLKNSGIGCDTNYTIFI